MKPLQAGGFTLIELLVSLTIGALVLVSTIEIFVHLRGSLQYQSEWHALQERGRHLLLFFQNELKKVDYPQGVTNSNALSATNGSGSNSDTLTLSYEGARDCAGSRANTVQYALQQSDIRCDGNGGSSPTPQTLTSHVDGLQLRFGADTDSDGSVDRYWRADQVSNWSQVQSITIAALLRSEAAVRESIDENHYSLLEVEYGPFQDHYLRRIYQTTVQLRNRQF